MSEEVKLTVKLPGGKESEEFNGLEGLAQWFVEHPLDPVLVVAVIDAPKHLTDAETGADQVKIRWRKIEPLGSLSKVQGIDLAPDSVRDAMVAAQEKRLGRTPLPLEQGTVDEPLDEG